MRLQLRLLAAGAAVVGVTGLMATGAGAEVTVNVRPYLQSLNNVPLANEWGLGSTDPGNADSALCVITPDSPITYGGKINGAAGPNNVDLNVHYLNGTTLQQVAACVPTAISISTVTSATTNVVVGTATGGSLAVSTATTLQSGISATAVTTLRVNYSAGQTVKLPSGAVVVGGALTGDTHVDLDMKPAASITKSALNLTACADNQYIIDTTTHDGTVANAPVATKVNLVTPGTGTPHVGTAGTYVATIRDCAQSTAAVPGKTATSKISVLGHGAVSAQFLHAATVNPKTWDTTRGATCATVKTLVNTTTASIDATRTISCKGDYGNPIPAVLEVRNWISNAAGQSDPSGIQHPGAPVTLLSGTV